MTKKAKSNSTPPSDTSNASPKLRLLDNRVLVQIAEAALKTPGGILLPDTAKEKPQRGTVVGVGPGNWRYGETVERVPLQVKKGDQVLFMRYSGVEVLEFHDYLIMREDDILAVLG